MNSTEVPGFSDSNCLPIAVRLLIIDDEANTVMVAVGGGEWELHPAAETINIVPAVTASHRRARIIHDDTE
jgi:hypothetical protein